MWTVKCRWREQFYSFLSTTIFNLNRLKFNFIFDLALFKRLPKNSAHKLKGNRCKPRLQPENEDELFEQSKN